MKKMLVLSFALLMFLSLAVYDSHRNNTNETSPLSTTPIESELTESWNESSNGGDTVSNNSDVRIKLLFDNGEVIVKMYDNPTSRDFLTLLPLTVTFEDYAGTEKISLLERRLSTEDAPAGSDPSVGDFTYYSPWGNLAIFYRDFGYSNGLIILGNIESGAEKLANIGSDFTVKIEKIE
ncbi:cyclophilin-like fold protein [Methanosarcina sp. T3]|uniref:cyclophilin-like fold protein n=1 Tax=Methanosarcina sp. T3 TaxID=3439062 RepID=UPI003F84C1B0